MTTYVPAKKGAEFIFYAGLVSQSTGQFQVNPTIAAGDFKVSIDGGALANLATLPAVTPAGSRMVKFTLSTSEMNGDNVTVIGVDAAGSEWDEMIASIQTSVQQIDDLATQASVNTIDDFLDTEITDIRNRLPAALVGGRMDSSVGAMAADTLTASALAADAVTEMQAGLSTLTAAGVRSAVGLASANLDTQLDALPTAAENADAVWDEDATGHQTQGTFGQAIGDPVADTNTIYKAVVTDATGATVGVDVVAVKAETASIQSDTNDIQTRLPAALSGDGFMKADLKSIEDELTSGNNATLNLKQLNIQNSAGDALVSFSTGGGGNGARFRGNGAGEGLSLEAGATGDALELLAGLSGGSAISAQAFGGGEYAFEITSSGGGAGYIDGAEGGVEIYGGIGKSIYATNDIAVSDGDLTLTNIAKKVLTLDWTTVTGEAARSVLNALRKLRNKISFNGTNTLTIYKEDGTTSAYTQSVSTDDTQDPFKELGN